MPEILSQEEIDALLSALSTGQLDLNQIKKEEEEPKIRVYDFKRPSKFSKEQVRALHMMHDNFARLLTNYFSAQLRTLVQMTVASVDHQMTYTEFVTSLQNPTIMMIFSLEPLKGSAILEMNPGVAFAIIDRLLGGPGVSLDRSRALTEIEQSVMERVGMRILENFREVWKDVIDVEPRIEAMEHNPLFAQIASPNETVALITLNARVGSGEGFINICLPYMVLEPIIGKLTSRYLVSYTGKTSQPHDVEMVKQQLTRAQVEISAQLGSTDIAVSDLLGLQVGDCIRLNRGCDEPIEVRVGARTKYLGRPGTSGKKIGIQIVSVVEQDEEE
ncbi:MAG: flagellar motor switch protein FliM [Bacillota bacterium]